MTPQEFERIYKHVKSRYGIDLINKKEMIDGRLTNYVHMHGYENYNQFMDAVEMDASGQLEKKLVDLLTTNHTFFMREFEHFDFMRQVILPEMTKREAKSHDLRIWCGAASTGEEPYMLAMLLSDYFGFSHKDWDTTILATDLSREVLQKAVRGIYSEEQVEAIPETWKRRYLHHILGTFEYEITSDIKSQVLFRQFNLMDPFPFRKPLHIVFLRNVMIYFDQKTKNQLVQKVYDALVPGGYLIIGKTETIDRDAVPFQLVKPSIFQK